MLTFPPPRSFLASVATACALTGLASAQVGGTAPPHAPRQGRFLMVPEWNNQRVMLLNGDDGSVINPDFILNAPGTPLLPRPKASVQVAGQIWVSEQWFGRVYRFTDSTRPRILGTLPLRFTNPAGICELADRIYVAHAGADSFPPGVAAFSPKGTFLFSFPAPDACDVRALGNELLVASYSQSRIMVFSPTGEYRRDLYHADGPKSVLGLQQLCTVPGPGAAEQVWAAGWNGEVSARLFDAQGSRHHDLTCGPTIGIAPLGNGRMLVTNITGIETLGDGEPRPTLVEDFFAQFISGLDPCGISCLSDYNQDGSTDGADLEAFFIDWEQHTPCADADGDSAVQPDDIAAFLAAWEAGDC